MKIELIAIGNEILKGVTHNSNSTFISRELKKNGYSVFRHTVLGDASEEIKAGIEEAMSRSDVVIVTGGLGPTCDDCTKSVMSELFDTSCEFDEELAAELLTRFPGLLSVKQLSTVPLTATVLPNLLGTAPGFLFTPLKKHVVFLPGVPREMEEMMQFEVMPYLQKNFSEKENLYHRQMDLCLLNEDEVEEKICFEEGIDIGIYPSYGGVRVELSGKQDQQQKIDEIFSQLTSAFKDFIFSENGDGIEQAVLKVLEEQGKTVAFAESCTGGALAAAITATPGASTNFLGSIVAYANKLKTSILHVKEKTLQEKGAVSDQTVMEMVEGLFSITDTDYAVAISGIAGPGGGTNEKPVGTVYIAIGERGKDIDVGVIHAPPSRLAVIECTVNTVLGILWRRIKHKRTYFHV